MKRDSATEFISSNLGKIPYVGKKLQELYLWKPTMFNYMLVGASGSVLSYLLYEGLFRVLLLPYPGGRYLGMVITTVIVYFWNYSWNRRWSLKPTAQIQGMKRNELLELNDQIEVLLKSKFDAKGERVA